MSLVYVTGVSGSGKSAAMRELEQRGFEAHGVDEEGYADWIDRATGEVAPFPHGDVTLGFRDWYRRHRWVLSEARISALRDRFAQSDEPAFLAGVAEGEDEVRHLQGSSRAETLALSQATIKTPATRILTNRRLRHPGVRNPAWQPGRAELTVDRRLTARPSPQDQQRPLRITDRSGAHHEGPQH